MKRIASLILVLVIALSTLVGCLGGEKEYSLSIGVKVTETLASSKVAQSVASIVIDEDGKIVDCKLDCVEYSAYNRQGALVKTTPVSKVAQGEAYDAYSPMAAGHWFEQAAALEEYVIGKTQAEVAAIALGADGKLTDTEINTSCSIAVSDLLVAIDNAFKSEHKRSFNASKDLELGLSVVGSVKVTEGDTVNAKHSATYAAVVMAEGKVVSAIVDTAEPELVNVTSEGAASLKYSGTKREQGDAYDAYAPMAGGRWYAQVDAYADAAIGLTADNIATLATEGVAGCTIGVTDYKAGIEAAVKAAK